MDDLDLRSERQSHLETPRRESRRAIPWSLAHYLGWLGDSGFRVWYLTKTVLEGFPLSGFSWLPSGMHLTVFVEKLIWRLPLRL
jgi:hypothetical protein